MKNIDGRKLKHSTREEIRICAVKRVEAGESPEKVIQGYGFHRSCIYTWLAQYREGGIEALKTKKISGRPPKFSGKYLHQLYELITTKNPLQLEFEFGLWTREMIRRLIKKKFGINLSIVSVGRLLKKIGLSPQKPLRRAYQQDEKLVKKWLQEDYPKIKKLARKHGAEIYFGDEAGVRSDYHSGTTWAPVGKTPIIKSTGSRFSINLISAINNKGTMRFMTIKGTMNSDKFIEFLRRLIYRSNHPIYLIVDGHPVHHSKKVKQFVESQKGKLRLFYLPPYSPELNPDELVWSFLKHHKIGKKIIKDKNDFRQKIFSCMRYMQRKTKMIVNFFKEQNVRYALD
jgi:transposase